MEILHYSILILIGVVITLYLVCSSYLYGMEDGMKNARKIFKGLTGEEP